MIYDKSSFDYQSNKAELEVMEIYVPMTIRERTAIRSWVKRGHNIGSNPWDYWYGEEMCSCPDNNYDYWDELKERRSNRYKTE